MSELTRILKVPLTLALITFTGSLGTVGLPTPSGWATSINVFESAQPNSPGETLESRSSQPNRSSPFENLSGSQGGELDELGTELIGPHGETPQLDPTIADFAQIPDFTDSLTALEWVRQWADTGYWLETDQWSDFQAIAVAGYSPDIRYWLGRDRWAPFGAMPLGLLQGGASSNVSTSPEIIPRVYPTSTSRIGSAANDAHRGTSSHKDSSKQSTADDQIDPVTVFELALSMLKKVARQPAFYLIFLTGAGLLIWTYRRQTST